MKPGCCCSLAAVPRIASVLAEWLYEAGIGERRAVLIDDDRIIAARIETDEDGLPPDSVVEARLGPQVVPKRTALATLENGQSVMLNKLPKGVAEGGRFTLRVTRVPIPEPGNPKLAQAFPAPDESPIMGPDLLARIEATGLPVRHCLPHEQDWFEQAGWGECLDEAETGLIPFPGGLLRMSLTPAMTIFDVDGSLAPGALARAAAQAVGEAIMRHDLAGSIGVDFPSMEGKAERLAVADSLDAALEGSFERTGINGFGFLQIVRPRRFISLPERVKFDAAGHRARRLLRQIAREVPPVAVDRPVDRGVLRWLEQRPQYVEQLRRATGATIVFRLRDVSEAAS